MTLGTLFTPYRTRICETLPGDSIISSIYWHSSLVPLFPFSPLFILKRLVRSRSEPFYMPYDHSHRGLRETIAKNSSIFMGSRHVCPPWVGHVCTMFSLCCKIPHNTQVNHLTKGPFLLDNSSYLTGHQGCTEEKSTLSLTLRPL